MAKKTFSIGEIGTAKKQVEETVKQQLTILPELQELIPPLQSAEFEQLEQNLLAEGCREALLIWHDTDGHRYLLIDGHNRYKICKKHQLSFDIKTLHFENLEEVKLWMLNNQLGRRNLTDEQKSYLRGKRYEAQKAQGKRNDLTSGQNVQKLETTSGQNVQKSITIANEENVSEKTIRRDAQFAKGLDVLGKENPELKQEVLSGKTKVNKSHIQELAKLPHLPKVPNLEAITSFLDTEKPTKEGQTDEQKAKKEALLKCLQTTKWTEKKIKELKKVFEEYVNTLKSKN